MNYNAYPGKGRFYKGSLHGHSTRSDGCLTPRQTLDVYRRSGYAFAALTDHNVFNRESYDMPDDFLVLPAMEMQTLYAGNDGRNQCHHFVALAQGEDGMIHDERMPNDSYSSPLDVQATIDRLSAAGNLVMLCHPIWSNTTIMDYGSFNGLFAMEVFNTGCHYENNTGLCPAQWNDMLRSGVRLFATAVDDAHHLEHMTGGWVQVHAPEFNRKAILESLEKGRFYASTGPEIHELFIADGELIVRCSPCRRIYLLSDRIGGGGNHQAVPSDGGALLEARFSIPHGVRYVRVECMEDENRVAWSQPVWMDELRG